MTTLLAASAGGHLKQLLALRDRLPWDTADVCWITVDGPQARSLLRGEDARFVASAAPRDRGAVVANARVARSVMREHEITHAVSTGASLALSTLPLVAMRRRAAVYVESAARVDGPSLTGRLLRWCPGVQTYSQYAAWADGRRWRYAGSVFDGYAVVDVPARPVRSVVVTLGTERFPFTRLVTRLASVLPADVEVLWQLGSTPPGELRGRVVESMPARELEAAMASADLVVAHAGVGSALAALDAGRCPVLVPRRAAAGEHIDDHQREITRELGGRGLAIAVEAGAFGLDDLIAAAARRVERRSAVEPLRIARTS